MAMPDIRGAHILGTGSDVCVFAARIFPRAILPVPIFSENLWATTQYRVCRKCGQYLYLYKVHKLLLYLVSCGSNKNYLKEILIAH